MPDGLPRGDYRLTWDVIDGVDRLVGDEILAATIRVLDKPALSVTSSGPGTVAGLGIDCPGDCIESFSHGTEVTLIATPGANSVFDGWSGDCAGTAATCTVTMNASKSVGASFTAKPVLTVVSTGPGSVTGQGINCPGDCTEFFDPGAVVTLTEAPSTNAYFTSWGSACSGSATTCDVAMSTNRTVDASFATKPLLTVHRAPGDTLGSVSGPGIDCSGPAPGVDCSQYISPNGSVTLTASHPSGPSAFTGWIGAPECSDASLSCVVNFGTSDRTVTANFGDNRPTVTSAPRPAIVDTRTDGSGQPGFPQQHADPTVIGYSPTPYSWQGTDDHGIDGYNLYIEDNGNETHSFFDTSCSGVTVCKGPNRRCPDHRDAHPHLIATGCRRLMDPG